jgi:WD40 repeat protein
MVATASEDKTVKVWDTRTGKPLSTINTGGQNINIAWSPDGNYIAVGNKVFIELHMFALPRRCRCLAFIALM